MAARYLHALSLLDELLRAAEGAASLRCSDDRPAEDRAAEGGRTERGAARGRPPARSALLYRAAHPPRPVLFLTSYLTPPTPVPVRLRPMSLQAEIERASADINTDAYAMSIGEIVNLYRDDELIIRPAFQRLFRWTTYQKSRLIESILLGIPIPSIFVSQRDDGVWEVVDGLQRLSTILEFTGELKDETGARRRPSVLVGTDYLPDLEGRTYEEGPTALDSAQRISLKRSKLDVKIVKESATATTKYDLFDRLNSGGAILSDQEFRNSLIVMTDASFLDWLEDLRCTPDFQLSVAPSDKQSEEQYDLELVVRMLVLTNRTEEGLSQFRDLRALLTGSILEYAVSDDFDRGAQGELFRRTFDLLNRALNGSAFRRYDAETDRFLGGFSVSAFEVVSVGVATHIDVWEGASLDDLKRKVGAVWADPDFKRYGGGGINPTTRIPRTVALGRSLFESVA